MYAIFLQASLSTVQRDLESSDENYANLKSRVKIVATELKERRVECRNLSLNVQELTMLKASLEADKNDYQMKASKFEKLVEEKGEQIDSLQNNVTELRMNVKKKEKELAEKGSIGNKALTTYKKKAQASLANSNARAATANQAREDAEIDATNARNDAENALKAASEAEVDKEAAIAKALEEVQIFVDQIEDLKAERDNLKTELSDYQVAIAKSIEEVKEANKNREEMLEEWTTKGGQLEKEQDTVSSLEQDIAISRIKNKELEDQIYFLKEESENYASAAFMARQKDSPHNGNNNDAKPSATSQEPAESDGTIVMLQQELKIANDVIKDLKEALGAILLTNPASVEPKEIIESMKLSSPSNDGVESRMPNGNGNSKPESTPLFFAFEKQAELNTARNEITRLAALLGDAESTKMEASEAMQEMKTKMEEAESRLRRYEKLAPANGSRQGSSSYPGSQSYGNRRTYAMSPAVTNKDNTAMSSQNDSTVSLEYLKNIMLRYMNANSLNEKRALVPVIGAVLELTPDELTLAMQNVEKSAGVTGVGVSLIESMQNKGLSGLFG